MGFYYDKLIAMQEAEKEKINPEDHKDGPMEEKPMNESDVEKAVEDGIQSPKDVGIDLNHVEKVIAGDDGIEAHKEDIEDAMEGIVGDPLDECMIIMYESEYNFNQLMQCIGIAELNEFAQGKDFILEGGNLAAFIEKAKEILKGMWNKFKNLFNSVIDNIDKVANVNKALIKSKEDKIKEGFAKGNWNISDAYDFDAMNIQYNPVETAIVDHVNDTKTLPTNIQCVKNVSGVDVSNETSAAKDMADALKAKHLVKKEYTPKDSGVLNTVINIMKADKPSVALRQLYRTIDAEYKDLISDLDRLESSLNEDNKQRLAEIVKIVQYEKNLQHLYFTTCAEIQKKRCAQARKFALVWIKAADGEAANSKPVGLPEGKYDDSDVDPRLKHSVKAARAAGVPEDKLLKNKKDVVDFFTK